ncbi:16S rRNA (guanine(527)-N(7))-methyltransferase RsmG, partial [Listeria monocytogenes]
FKKFLSYLQNKASPTEQNLQSAEKTIKQFGEKVE